jgi:hypothetical protein
MLIIRDIRFETDSECSRIGGIIDPTNDFIRWAINISCHERIVDDVAWKPELSHESLPFKIRDWRQLEGIAGVFPPDNGKGNLGLYVFEHGEVGPSQISIRRRRGDAFEVEWTCLADVHYDESYGAAVPLHMRADDQFEGIRVAHPDLQTPEAATEWLANQFDVSTLLAPIRVDPPHMPLRQFLLRPLLH